MRKRFEKEPNRPLNAFTGVLVGLFKDTGHDDRFDCMVAAKHLRAYSRQPTPDKANSLHEAAVYADDDTRGDIRTLTARYLNGDDKAFIETDYLEAIGAVITGFDSYDLATIAKAVQLAYIMEDWQLIGSIETLMSRLDDSNDPALEETEEMHRHAELRAAINNFKFFHEVAGNNAPGEEAGSRPRTLVAVPSIFLDAFSDADELEQEEAEPKNNIIRALETLLNQRSFMPEYMKSRAASLLYGLSCDPSNKGIVKDIKRTLASEEDEVRRRVFVAMTDITNGHPEDAREQFTDSLGSIIEDEGENYNLVLLANAVRLAGAIKAWGLSDAIEMLMTRIQPLLSNDEEGKGFIKLAEEIEIFNYEKEKVFRDYINLLSDPSELGEDEKHE